ncbi:AraC family transcriptional regulator [Levilactobacillus wangkuiensis]|uniref:AraC family transcriptional regulator n=1 Tax=Levilactobacillus wangkuiensis TaxID=2799566 RepID=UPI001941FF00|nr:AraC family transcriptional regulator [Levilactobacillus wangkuiensis]
MDRQHHENVVSNLDIGIRFFESTVTRSGYVPFHWHSSIELVCVLSGQLTFQFDGQAHVIHANQFSIVSSGVIHDVTNTPNRSLVLQIPLTFIERYVAHPEQLNFSTAGQEQTTVYQEVVTEFKRLAQINRERQPNYLIDTGITVLTMLKTMVSNFTDTANPLTTSSSSLKSIVIYVNEHYREKLSVKAVAHRFGYNASYLSRLFKEQTGVTLGHYVYLIRLNNFYRDLIDTTIPVDVLMDKHGLTNRRTAREMFQEMYGALPKQVRLQYQRN